MKKFLSILLAGLMVLSLAACENGTKPTEEAAKYERGEDDVIYNKLLADYEKLVLEAETKSDLNERFVIFAKAEAILLDSAVMVPTTTQGGTYAITHAAPRRIPFAQWGNDEDRLKGIVLSDSLITKEERAEMLEQWSKACKGEGTYDPEAYLISKGHKIVKDYVTTFSTAPVTFDWLNTSSQSDTELTVNLVDGLVEYDNLGVMQPALAESWDVSEDGTVYTFHIRKGVKWYTSEGTEYAEVTAKDFVSGLRHMLDAKAGLEYLVDGVIVGATEYYDKGGSWDNVKYIAKDDYTLEVTLEKEIPYFLTMLTYSCFLPVCTSFYEAHGGVFGVEEYEEALEGDAYTFGMNTDIASQVFCGPYLLQKFSDQTEIYIIKNEKYYKADEVKLNSIKWVKDAGEHPEQSYKDACDGIYVSINLLSSNGTMDLAVADGNFEKCAYITDTTSTTYFGGLNMNRGTFALKNGACASNKTEQQKIDTETAMMNKNFRKAIVHSFDKGSYNGVSAGEDLKYNALRNMYTHPEFVSLTADTTDADGHTFAQGTLYGEMVQYYVDQLGCKVTVKDGVDGWFNPDAAKEYLAKAVEELGDTITWPIQIDVVYYGQSESQKAQSAVYKKATEETLGTDKVIVNLIEATTTDDFYACGYRATTGEAGLFDMFYGSGWGPDYGDPSTYLDTFKGMGAGYMTKVIGLF